MVSMDKHYSDATIGEWYKTSHGRERFGFGLDHPRTDGKTSADYLTFHIDHQNTLTVSAGIKRGEGENYNDRLSVACGTEAIARDFAERCDVAMGSLVRDLAPSSIERAREKNPALTVSDADRDLAGLRTRKDVKNALSLCLDAVNASYRAPANETIVDATQRAGLRPLQARKGGEGWVFQGNDKVHIEEFNGQVCIYSSQKDRDGEYPLLGQGATPALAIATTAREHPSVFKDLVREGEEAALPKFVAVTNAAAAVATWSERTTNTQEQQLKLSGVTAETTDLRKLLAGVTMPSPAISICQQAPARMSPSPSRKTGFVAHV
jgi:hypothetical protein